jgi:hypothetical protein
MRRTLPPLILALVPVAARAYFDRAQARNAHGSFLTFAHYLAVVAAIVAIVAIPSRVLAQPVWTDIMNQLGQTSIASGNWWEFHNLDPAPYDHRLVSNTDLTQFPDHPVLSIPGLSSGHPSTSGGYDPACNRSVGTPTQYLESNYGTGIKGVGFLGSFDGHSMPGSDFGPGAWLFESVFFHEQKCYNGGREYGFFYDPYGNGVWFYWGTNENLSTVVQAQVLMPNVYPNFEYYYEIYPTGNSSSCGFEITVLDTGFRPVFGPAAYNVNAANYPAGKYITQTDPGFCAAVTSSAGESGYVTANSIYQPPVSNIPSNTAVNLQRIFVGK